MGGYVNFLLGGRDVVLAKAGRANTKRKQVCFLQAADSSRRNHSAFTKKGANAVLKNREENFPIGNQNLIVY